MDVNELRAEFPILQRRVHGDRPLIYLDNAATTLTPKSVIRRLTSYHASGTSNIHRGVHYLSNEATQQFEACRAKVKSLINAQHSSEIIFTSGTTLALNMLAQSLGQQLIGAGDEIIVTEMEHHSNIVPWQLLCQRLGCVLKYIPLTPDGELDRDILPNLWSSRTKILSVVHVSNSLGTVNPLNELVVEARKHGVMVVVDAAQSLGHLLDIDVQQLDCDFLVFSGHKLFAPTGVGVLYGKKQLLDKLSPPIAGGGMVAKVTMEESTFLASPEKFEAGTPNIAGVLGLDAAIDFWSALDRPAWRRHEQSLLTYASNALQSIDGLRIIGTASNKEAIISFVVEDVHPHDLGTILDLAGVAIRAGHHCTQPVMRYFKIPATARVSFALYNTIAEIDTLVASVIEARNMFQSC